MKNALHINSLNKKRADLKYAVKHLTAQLRQYIEHPQAGEKSGAQIIEAVIQNCTLLYGAPTTAPATDSDHSFDTLEDYINQYQDLTQQLNTCFNEKIRSSLLQQLWQCLYNIQNRIQQYDFNKAQSPSTYHNSLFHLQNNQSENWFQWLGDLIGIYRQQPQWTTQFCQRLTDDELKKLARSFCDRETQALFNSIFYFKLHPQELLPEQYLSEDLLRCNQQVSDLYAQIENLFQALQHSFIQRFNLKLPDFLYHGETLPRGVSFVAEKKHARMLQSLLQKYPLIENQMAPQVTQNPALELLRSYKFWFNPIRLINAVLSIWTRGANQGQTTEQNRRLFYRQLAAWFQKLSTSECVDLYGYFDNKDTHYLLHTLERAASNKQEAALPVFDSFEKEQIFFIYYLLNTGIEVMQEELRNRNIITSFHHKASQNTNFNPGKRNLEALKHICENFCGPQRCENTILHSLLDDMENEG